MQKFTRVLVWVALGLVALGQVSCGASKAAPKTHSRGGCNCGF